MKAATEAFQYTSFASVFLNHCAHHHAQCQAKFSVEMWQMFLSSSLDCIVERQAKIEEQILY